VEVLGGGEVFSASRFEGKSRTRASAKQRAVHDDALHARYLVQRKRRKRCRKLVAFAFPAKIIE
jgi:hypothetical protein